MLQRLMYLSYAGRLGNLRGIQRFARFNCAGRRTAPEVEYYKIDITFTFPKELGHRSCDKSITDAVEPIFPESILLSNMGINGEVRTARDIVEWTAVSK